MGNLAAPLHIVGNPGEGRFLYMRCRHQSTQSITSYHAMGAFRGTHCVFHGETPRTLPSRQFRGPHRSRNGDCQRAPRRCGKQRDCAQQHVPTSGQRPTCRRRTDNQIKPRRCTSDRPSIFLDYDHHTDESHAQPELQLVGSTKHTSWSSIRLAPIEAPQGCQRSSER